MNESFWYISRNGQNSQAMTFDQLRQLAASGALSPMDHVWTSGMPHWQPAMHVEGLFAALTPPPPPPPTLFADGQIGYATPAIFDPNAPPTYDRSQRFLLPVGRSGWAIAAGYLGLLSFIPFVGIAAIVVSVIAWRYLRRHPESLGMGRILTGLILGLAGCIFFAMLFYNIMH